ncbi:MAG: hypothetical protein WAN50_03270 [Minisyncoccia bacterium]
MVRHSKLDRHHQHVIGGKKTAIVSLYVLNYGLLQKPTDLAAVHRITGKAIYLPTHDALRFARDDTSDYIVKDGTTRLLRGLLLHELGRNLQPLALSEGAQLRELRVYREDLLVLDIGTLAGVEEVVGHRHYIIV